MNVQRPRSWRLTPLATAASLLLTLTACGGGGSPSDVEPLEPIVLQAPTYVIDCANCVQAGRDVHSRIKISIPFTGDFGEGGTLRMSVTMQSGWTDSDTLVVVPSDVQDGKIVFVNGVWFGGEVMPDTGLTNVFSFVRADDGFVSNSVTLSVARGPME